MKGACVGLGTVIGIKFIFGIFGCKTRGSCMHDETAEKQGSFSSFIACDITCKLMRW